VEKVLRRYARAYGDQDVNRLRALFADDLVRRNGTEPREHLGQALATYQSQFDQLSSPRYALSGVTVTPARGEASAVGIYTISDGGAPARGRIAFHLAARGGRLLIDRITIKPVP
jgi:hypothetical protein